MGSIHLPSQISCLNFQAQVEMNWNIVNFLPKAASCQEFFKVLFLLRRFFLC